MQYFRNILVAIAKNLYFNTTALMYTSVTTLKHLQRV